jgi:hypothetical protein
MWSIIELGLQKGIDCFADQGTGWWTVVRGNWNCALYSAPLDYRQS